MNKATLFCTKPKNSRAGTARDHISAGSATLIVLFTFLIFANTISHYFVMDDFDVLYSVKSNSLPQALLGYGTVLTGRFFRPVPMLFFWLQFKLFGPSPVPFHVTTLLLHAACAILAANLFYLLFRDSWIASIFGFVFVAFPNHAEVIHSVAINLTSVATLFFLATLNAFCYYKLSSKKSVYALSIILFVATVLSHEMTYILPFALIASDYFLSRSRHIDTRLSRNVLNHGPYVLLLSSILIVIQMFLNTGSGYLTVEGESIIPLYMNNVYILCVDLVHMYLRGFKYLFIPISPEFPHSSLVIALVALTLCSAAALLVWKRRLNVVALIYCFFFATITLLPIIGTYRFQEITHWVRFLYLPSVATCYVVAMVLGGLSIGVHRPLAKLALLVIFAIPVIFLTKFYDQKWVEAEDESKQFVNTMVEKCSGLPQYSRVYVSRVPQMKERVPRIGYALASAVGLYCDRTSLEVDSDFLPAIKILNLEREPYDNRHWNYFWLTWDAQTGTLNETAPIRPGDGEIAPRTWSFDEPRNQAQLEVATDISTISAPHSPVQLFKIEGGWALLKLPLVGAGPPIKYLTLEMMLKGKSVGRDISRVFWATEKTPKYTGGRSIGFYTMRDSKLHEYRVPLYRNGQSLIDPHIVRFAIRPSQDPDTIFAVKSMTVEYY